MFEVNEENAAALERLIAATDGMERGQILAHATIEEATGYSQLERRYYYIVARWRKHMLKTHSIAAIEEPNVGWYLCTKKDQVGRYERKRAAKANRQLGMARDALNQLDDADLSLALRLLKHAKLKMLKETRKTLRKKQELRDAINRPQQRQPIRRPAAELGDDQQPQPAA